MWYLFVVDVVFVIYLKLRVDLSCKEIFLVMEFWVCMILVVVFKIIEFVLFREWEEIIGDVGEDFGGWVRMVYFDFW